MMAARFKWYSDPLSPHQQKNIVRVGPTLTKLSGSAHASTVVAYIANTLDQEQTASLYSLFRVHSLCFHNKII